MPAGSGEPQSAPGVERVVVALTRDRLVLAGLQRISPALGMRVVSGEPPAGTAPAAFVVDLEQPSVLDEIRRLRQRHSTALLAGHLGIPRPDLWVEAQGAGCDLVANRGALAARLLALIESWRGPESPRIALFEAAEVAGRLGLVHRSAETTVGPLAVYRIGSELVAIADLCPHAGARLSDGELAGPVVTCPRHGSQFDVRSGARLRGPADLALETFSLLEEGGYVYLIGPRRLS
jgi:nitrite reductase/ring-hydroxylating ferredoxin subunit